MSSPTTFRWIDGGLVAGPGADGADPAAGRLLVADSWLVDDGLVRALDVHRDRFAGSVAAALGEAAPTADAADGADGRLDVDAFWSAAVARLPRTGAWFPRVELVSGAGRDGRDDGPPELRLLLRPAPARTRSVVLATAPHDPRTRPTVKGPDLRALGRLREDVGPLGADEAVLLDPDGHVVDGAWSSIVWWRGDALCLPADDLPRLPGVTVRTLATLAAVLGVDVLHERTTPAELDGFEIWTTSALQGIRIVTDWVDGPTPAEQPGRLALWRSRLEALRRPLADA